MTHSEHSGFKHRSETAETLFAQNFAHEVNCVLRAEFLVGLQVLVRPRLVYPDGALGGSGMHAIIHWG